MVYNWLNNIHFRLFPPHCMLCDARGNGEGTSNQDLCPACHEALPRIEKACPICALPLETEDKLICGQCLQKPPPYNSTFSPWRYAPPLGPLITNLKFHQQLSAARLLGQLLSNELKQNDVARPDCIIPVPLHPCRIHERGFNQSIEIARFIAKEHALPIDSRLCKRIRHTLPQTGLDAKTRRKNIRNAFTLTKTCHYRHVAIIDDVITTGNTVTEISALLRKNGVEEIQVWSVARAMND